MKSGLAKGLDNKAKKQQQKAAAVTAPAAAAPAATNGTAPRQRGSVISGYFDKRVQKELRMLSIKEATTVNRLVGEALALLFQDRKMPEIAALATVAAVEA